uniref:2-dehydropantoate 2-reductase n=1 Tax=uncultured Candidatus Melainabacteria bacterium TaxID=2682970 RepID=A0A650EKS6_9BACT|nr:2-dehydropantoate 2-reductase [uncultured Candidatus Melainabacteria bacterium]
MKEINTVLICGIGAVGSIYANKINEYDSDNLRVLVDKKRLENYIKNPKVFNGKSLNLNYILPEDNNFKADLIIIATKFDGLLEVIKNIKNFVKEETIIISLLNGVTSEEIIAEHYGWKNLPLAYFIGHSAMRDGNKITHDGIGDIVFGVKNSDEINIEIVDVVKQYFDKVGIDYKTPENMYRAYWLKYMLNVSCNQASAILRMTFGQMQDNKKFVEFLKNVMREVQAVAKAQGVVDTETMINEAFVSFYKMIKEGKTSMLQDVEAKRITEVEMFSGTIINLGKKHSIPTPYNLVMKDMIEIIHENYNFEK